MHDKKVLNINLFKFKISIELNKYMSEKVSINKIVAYKNKAILNIRLARILPDLSNKVIPPKKENPILRISRVYNNWIIRNQILRLIALKTGSFYQKYNLTFIIYSILVTVYTK